MKNVLAALMLLAISMGMASCSGLVDAIIGDIDTPVSTTPATQPTTVEKVVLNDKGASVTASSASEATQLLATLTDDIKAKGVGIGKEYVIELVGDAIKTSSDLTISVPQVEGANLNLVFGEAFNAGTKLNINASDLSSAPSKADNTLVITLSPANDLCLNVDMPKTTVTLKSGGSLVNFKEVKSRTALNTMIIADEVKVDTMDIEGGTVQVNEGGILESWVYAANHNDEQVNITEDGGIEPIKIFTTDADGNPVEQWQIASEDGEPYYAKSLKVEKGEADYSTVHFFNASYDAIPLKTVVVGDGAILRTNWVAMENIQGEGKAEIKYLLINPQSYTDDTEYGGDKFYEFNCDMSGIKNLKNITISQPEIKVHEAFQAELDAKIAEGYIMHEPRLNMDINGVVEGCTFMFNHVHFCQERSLTCPEVKNCKFVHVESNYSNEDLVEIRIPYIEGSASNTITFDGCEFSEGTKFMASFFGNFGFPSDDETHYTGYVNFNNCKLGNAAFTGENTDFVKYFWAVTGTKMIISFDGTPKYEAVFDSEGGGFIVRAIGG